MNAPALMADEVRLVMMARIIAYDRDLPLVPSMGRDLLDLIERLVARHDAALARAQTAFSEGTEAGMELVRGREPAITALWVSPDDDRALVGTSDGRLLERKLVDWPDQSWKEWARVERERLPAAPPAEPTVEEMLKRTEPLRDLLAKSRGGGSAEPPFDPVDCMRCERCREVVDEDGRCRCSTPPAAPSGPPGAPRAGDGGAP